MVEYDAQKIEKKWQQKWEEDKIFEVNVDLKKKKILCIGDVSISFW